MDTDGKVDITTFKITKALRDRITAAAVRNQTVQGFMERLMDEHDRQGRFVAVATAMSGADEDTLRDWRAETEQWAALGGDLDALR